MYGQRSSDVRQQWMRAMYGQSSVERGEMRDMYGLFGAE